MILTFNYCLQRLDNISRYIRKVEDDNEICNSSPPNIVQEVTGYLTRPVEVLPEISIMSINDYLSQATIKKEKIISCSRQMAALS